MNKGRYYPKYISYLVEGAIDETKIKELESMENQFSCGIYSGNLIITKEQEKLLKPVLRILDISYNIWI